MSFETASEWWLYFLRVDSPINFHITFCNKSWSIYLAWFPDITPTEVNFEFDC